MQIIFIRVDMFNKRKSYVVRYHQGDRFFLPFKTSVVPKET